MTPKSKKTRGREAAMRSKGYAQVKAWVPDTPKARAALQEFAAILRAVHEQGGDGTPEQLPVRDTLDAGQQRVFDRLLAEPTTR